MNTLMLDAIEGNACLVAILTCPLEGLELNVLVNLLLV
jgi:hypothetical protein